MVFSARGSGPGLELVGVTEVAVRLGLTAERVRQLSKSGAMPEPLGALGRRAIWEWRDVEAWARSQGRLESVEGESRQVTAPWRQRPRGALRLVVDEILQWGSREFEVCHVRVWAPPAGSGQPQIVVLGELQDAFSSVTNRIEDVAMAVAARHLGPSWRSAQFYQYGPPTRLDDGETFLHVTFAIRATKAGRGLGGRASYLRTLGAELTGPQWRRTTREELEHITGDSPQAWAPGTYTRALVERSRSAGERLELVWDPQQARELAAISAALTSSAQHLPGGFAATLEGVQRAAVGQLIGEAGVDAYETARQDVATQPMDAAISLRLPRLAVEARPGSADGVGLIDLGGRALWDALMTLRQALVDRRFEADPRLERQRRLLVPGLRGGWVPLRWADAGVEEEQPRREGWGGPIALPEDLVHDGVEPASADGADLTVLLLDTIASHLAETWDSWTTHDVPVFLPSTVLAASGPLTRAYLDQLSWMPVAQADPERLARLSNRGELHRIAVDDDGWLVGIPKGRAWFVCEWPVSGLPDPSLCNYRVRADLPGNAGSTPVYLVGPETHVRLMPSAGRRQHGNSFAWGYGGGGPWNFTEAVVDLLTQTCPTHEAVDEPTARDVVRDLVASPRTPDWAVADLLTQVARRHPPQRSAASRP